MKPLSFRYNDKLFKDLKEYIEGSIKRNFWTYPTTNKKTKKPYRNTLAASQQIQCTDVDGTQEIHSICLDHNGRLYCKDHDIKKEKIMLALSGDKEPSFSCVKVFLDWVEAFKRDGLSLLLADLNRVANGGFERIVNFFESCDNVARHIICKYKGSALFEVSLWDHRQRTFHRAMLSDANTSLVADKHGFNFDSLNVPFNKRWDSISPLAASMTFEKFCRPYIKDEELQVHFRNTTTDFSQHPEGALMHRHYNNDIISERSTHAIHSYYIFVSPKWWLWSQKLGYGTIGSHLFLAPVKEDVIIVLRPIEKGTKGLQTWLAKKDMKYDTGLQFIKPIKSYSQAYL